VVTFCLIIFVVIKYPPSFDKSGEWGLAYIVIFWWGLTIPFSFLGAVGARLAPQNLPMSVMTQIGVAGGLFYVFFISTNPNLPLFWFLFGVSITIYIWAGLLTWSNGVESNSKNPQNSRK